jgi:uncharacterized membrane protein
MTQDGFTARGAGNGDRREGPAEMAGPAERWVAMLGGTALGVAGLRRGDWTGAVLAALGGGLFLAGAAGVPLAGAARDAVREGGLGSVAGLLPSPGREPTTTQSVVTIAAPAERLFRFWRNFGNLPKLMDHLEAVEIQSEKRSHWKARGPGGITLDWFSEIDKERENELISWHTLEGSRLPHRGTVMFRPAPGGRGTEVRLTLAYHLPGGEGGRAVARVLGSLPGQQAREALRRMKQLMEAGEIATTNGQPSGSRGVWRGVTGET